MQLELEEYFGQFGDIKQVRMRRNNETSAFKGSVFVEYSTLDEANKVASSKLQYKDQDLLVMSKYVKRGFDIAKKRSSYHM